MFMSDGVTWWEIAIQGGVSNLNECGKVSRHAKTHFGFVIVQEPVPYFVSMCSVEPPPYPLSVQRHARRHRSSQ
jgi:hypothetical protein